MHETALLVEFKYGVDNDYETRASMKMATASLAHDYEDANIMYGIMFALLRRENA